MENSTPQLAELYEVLKDSPANHDTLLLNMGVGLPRINGFRATHLNEEAAFLNCLEYFLNNFIDGNVWARVRDALISCGDNRTAKRIQENQQLPNYNVPGTPSIVINQHEDQEEQSIYDDIVNPSPAKCEEIKPHPDSFVSKDDKDEYIFKLKTLTTTQYNAATRNIREVHQDIQKALEHESSEAKKVLLSYDANAALKGDRYERDIKELSERVTDQIKILEKAIESLKQGRSTGMADVKKVSEELFELEKLHNHLDKRIRRYQRMFSHSSESKSSWAEVHQDLKASINVTINVEGKIDEENYYVY